MMLVVKNPLANAGNARDVKSISGLGRSPGVGSGHLLQYSCLEHSMDTGTWWATVHGVAKSQTQLSDFHFRPFCSGSFSRKSPNRAQDSRKSVVRAHSQ